MQNLLFECAVRAVLIASGTAVVLGIMQVKTASARHAAWASVLLLMLLLPMWTAWGPKAIVRVLPPLPARATMYATRQAVPPIEPVAFRLSSGVPDPVPMRSAWSWPLLLLAAYLLGVSVLLARLAFGTIRARRLLRRAARDGALGVFSSRACSAPLTVGWFRPAVILPDGWQHWPHTKLDAVLAHEREHARRRDPLIQWLALLNRAVFWFHPLAWWLECRLSALAEEVCDAAVLSRGHHPRDYSEYLLDIARSVERSGARLHIWGMAMPGSFLGPRIRRMLEANPTPRTSRTRLACTTIACAMVSVVFTTGALDRARAQAVPVAQQAADSTLAGHATQLRLLFNGAVHKLNVFFGGQRFRELVATAYGVEEYQVEVPLTWWDRFMTNYALRPEESNRIIVLGSASLRQESWWDRLIAGFGLRREDPVWMFVPMYPFAKAPPDTPPERAREMLQTRLAERFHLKTHRESRSVPLYWLVAGPNAATALPPGDSSPGASFAVYPGHMHIKNTELSNLAVQLARFLPRPLVDRTNILGRHAYDLEWTPDATELKCFFGKNLHPNPDSPLSPGLLAALDHLGLRIEAHQDPMDVIIIDHAERPR